MAMQRASALLLGLLGIAASCTQLVLDGNDYRPRDAASSGASSAGGSSPVGVSSGEQSTSAVTSTGASPPNCTSGFTACGGACVLITSDSKHCGACDRDCQGQPCIASVCSPRVTIADHQDLSGYIAVDASGVYWTGKHDGSLWRAPLNGSSGPTKLGGGQGDGRGIVLNGGFVYWANQGNPLMTGTIQKMPVAGGTPEVLVSEKGLEMLAVTPTHLFWSGTPHTTDPNYVRKKALSAGSTPATIASSDFYSWRVACDQKNVYAVNDNGVLMKFSLTGEAPTIITKAASDAQHMAVAGGYVYYTNDFSGTVERVPIGGGAPETFYDGSDEGVSSTYGITVDDKYVYWTEDSEGIIRKAPLSGGPWKASSTTVLAVVQGGMPQGIAVDGAYVYWANYFGGSVMKTPK